MVSPLDLLPRLYQVAWTLFLKRNLVLKGLYQRGGHPELPILLLLLLVLLVGYNPIVYLGRLTPTIKKPVVLETHALLAEYSYFGPTPRPKQPLVVEYPLFHLFRTILILCLLFLFFCQTLILSITIHSFV